MNAPTQSKSLLPPSHIANAILAMRHTGVSLYVHGAPGISKSAVAHQMANQLGIAFVDFRLTSVAPEDVRGVPFFADVGGMQGMIWSPPLMFPRDLDLSGTIQVDGATLVRFYNPVGDNGISYCTDPQISVECLDGTARVLRYDRNSFVVTVDGDGKNKTVIWRVIGRSQAIFALEEFNSASPSVMAAAYQLILDRRIGDYMVPDGVMLLAMGNRRGDKGVTFELPKPVANRFIHLEMVVNFADWQTWAIEHQIHPDVLGYLSKWRSHLFDEDFAKKPDHSFATPRSWEFISKIITETRDSIVANALICGAVGEANGTQFIAHRKFMADMPNVNDVLDGSVTNFLCQHPEYTTQIAYSTCVQICYALKQESDAVARSYHDDLARRNSMEHKQWVSRADRAIGYVLDNFSPEIITMFSRMALQAYRLPFNTKIMQRYREFTDTYKDSVLHA